MPERLSDHVTEGPIERGQDEPIGFRIVGHRAVPVYTYRVKVYETWRDQTGQKYGRWTCRYV